LAGDEIDDARPGDGLSAGEDRARIDREFHRLNNDDPAPIEKRTIVDLALMAQPGKGDELPSEFVIETVEASRILAAMDTLPQFTEVLRAELAKQRAIVGVRWTPELTRYWWHTW
jgi:hypothetical protein